MNQYKQTTKADYDNSGSGVDDREGFSSGARTDANSNKQSEYEIFEVQSEISKSTTTTEVFETHKFIEYTDENQAVFQLKLEEAKLRLADLEIELKNTREKIGTLQGACESTEEKIGVLKDATNIYQEIAIEHEYTFKSITEENKILRIQVKKTKYLEEQLQKEKEENKVLEDRVIALEREKGDADDDIDRLASQLSDYDDDFKLLRDRINEIEIECTTLRTEVHEKDEEIDRLRKDSTDMDDVRDELARKHEECTIYVTQTESLSQECDVLRKDKDFGQENLQKEIESLKLKYDQIEGEKGILEKEKIEIFDELSSLEERLRDLEGLQVERFELQKKYNELKSRYEEFQAENTDFVDQINTFVDLESNLRGELEEVRKKHVKVVSYNTDLADQCNLFEDAESKLRREIEDLTVKLTDYEKIRLSLERMREFESKNKIMVVEKETLERKLGDEQRLVKELRLKMERYKKDGDELDGKSRTQRNKISDLERELREVTTERDRLAQQIKDLKVRSEEDANKLAELKARCRELEQKLRDKDKDIKEIREDNEKLEEELDSLNATFDAGKAEYGRVIKELEELREENDALRNEIEELKLKEEEVVVVETAPLAASEPEFDFTEQFAMLENDLRETKKKLAEVEHEYQRYKDDAEPELLSLRAKFRELQILLEDSKTDKNKLEVELEKINKKYDLMVEEYNRKIKDLEERCESQRKELVDKEVKISQLRREETRYKVEIDELEQQISDNKKEMEKGYQLVKQLQEEIIELKSRISNDNLGVKYEELSKEHDLLRKEKNKLEKEIQFLSEELRQADDLSINDNKDLDDQIKDLQRMLRVREDEIERFKSEKNTEFRDEDWRTKFESLKIKYDSLERERDNLKRDKQDLHKDYMGADDELQNVRARYTKSKKQLDEANIEINSLRIRIKEFSNSYEVESLKRDIKRHEWTLEKKNEDCEVHQRELDALKRELQRMSGEEWREKFESLKLKYDELDGEKDSLHKEKSALQRELRFSAAKLAELEIKLSQGSGDEKRLKEELHVLRIKLSELEVSVQNDGKGRGSIERHSTTITILEVDIKNLRIELQSKNEKVDDSEKLIDHLRMRIIELEREVGRLKKLLMDASDDNKSRDVLQGEIEDLEKEVIILTHEVELKTARLSEARKDNDNRKIRIDDLENQIKNVPRMIEPQRMEVVEAQIEELASSVPTPLIPLFPETHETTTIVVDVKSTEEIVLGVLIRSKIRRESHRFQGKGREYSELDFSVEALPGTVLVGTPIAVKVDVTETPSIQYPDIIDGFGLATVRGEEPLSPLMADFNLHSPDTFPPSQDRSISPVVQTLQATEVSSEVPTDEGFILVNTHPDMREEPTSRDFRPVPPPRQARPSPSARDMMVPRGKLVPIRAVLRDSAVVLRTERPPEPAPRRPSEPESRQRISPSDVVLDGGAFKPVEFSRAKSFSGGELPRMRQEHDTSRDAYNGYSNGYHDSRGHPRDQRKRYQEEREVKAYRKKTRDDGDIRRERHGGW